MRILFASHTGDVSGAEVAMLRLIARLGDAHEAAVACPPAGPLADAVDRAGIARLPVVPTDVSLRLHPAQTPVGLARLAAGALTLRRAVRRFRPDVVHANSTRAGLMAAGVARGPGAVPVVVQEHDRLPPGAATRAAARVVGATARAVVANSDASAAAFDAALGRPLAGRVHPGVDHARFDAARVDPSPLRTELGLAPGARLLGQVAQITPWKGQDVAVRALAGVRRAGVDAHLLVVGAVAFARAGVRHDNHAFARALHALVAELGVGDAVHFLGRREDVPGLVRALDLTLHPSWDEPFGLAVLESMALGTPPLVTEVGGPREFVEDGVSGRLLPPHAADAWTGAALALLADEPARRRMGEHGVEVAARFTDAAYVRGMLAAYEGARVASTTSRRRARKASGEN